MDRQPTFYLRRSGLALARALAGLLGASLLVACGSSNGSPSAAPGSMPVTFVYTTDGLAAGAAHTTHLQVVDGRNVLVGELVLKTVGNVDTGTLALLPGNYSAISWDEQPASPKPLISTKCGSPFTIDPGQALLVTITSSKLGACLTDTLEPNASPSPS